MPLQRLLHEPQCRRFVPILGDVAFQDLTFVIDGSPQVLRLAIDLYEHLINVPAPVPEATHVVYATPPDLSCEHRTETVPPKPNRLVAEIISALEQQVLHIPK